LPEEQSRQERALPPSQAEAGREAPLTAERQRREVLDFTPV